jgi:hypothetical protein
MATQQLLAEVQYGTAVDWQELAIALSERLDNITRVRSFGDDEDYMDEDY